VCEIFIDNLLVRIHFTVVMMRWTGLAPWKFEFPFSGSLTSRLSDLVLHLGVPVSATSEIPFPGSLTSLKSVHRDVRPSSESRLLPRLQAIGAPPELHGVPASRFIFNPQL
jgi:hypothetical protein